jgi:hypothetical protein
MKKILLILIIFAASCSEDCSVDSQKLGALGVEAEALRIKIIDTNTPALRNVYQLQLDLITQEMDAVAQECF